MTTLVSDFIFKQSSSRSKSFVTKHDMMEPAEKKKILMEIVKRINSASEDSIKLLQNTTISNTRAIRRASRNTRDPNPLSSALATMGLKYPLSIDLEGAIKYNVPTHFLCNLEDNHQHGRILCRREVVDWWVEKSELPNENTIQLIKALYRQHTKDVEEYNLIKWEGTRITFGPVTLERKPVATQIPARRVPKDLREDVLIQSLVPHHSIPYARVSKDLMKEIEDIKIKSLHSSMSFVSHVRIIMQAFDPKVRYQPSLPGSSDLSGAIRFALCGANWTIQATLPVIEGRNHELNRLLDEFCCATHNILLDQDTKWDKLVQTIKQVRINGMSVQQTFSICQTINTESASITKALLGIPISMESRLFNVRFTPHLTTLFISRRVTKVGVPYKVYSETESVSFEYNALRGSFTHDGEILTEIITNSTNKSDLAHVIACIAVYCRKLFPDALDKTFPATVDTVYNYYLQNPEKVIGASRRDWLRRSFRQGNADY